jgi:hypothetical protein
MSKAPRSLEILGWIYRLLLVAYPASFRREYEEEMISVFRDMAEAAWRRDRRAGLFWLAWCVAVDFVGSVPRQHLEETHRRIVMWQKFLGPAHFLVALAAALLIAALVTPADPASQLLVGIPLFMLYLFIHFTTRIWRKRSVSECTEGEADLD